MPSLTDTIAAGMARSHGLLERELLRTTDPATIAAHVDRWCAGELDSTIVAGLTYASSVGLLIGVELADGRRVAVKIIRREHAHHLSAIREAQAVLADGVFPAPTPIGAPTRIVDGIAVAETWLDSGACPDGHADGDRRVLVTALHELLGRGRTSATTSALETPWPVRDDTIPLWPPPHDLRFDFVATAAGAEWIDVIARAARAALADARDATAAGGWVIGHHDWRAEHVRLDRDRSRVIAVYDWDSLRRTTEAACVGDAAWMLPADWTVAQERPLCDADEIDDFVARYEDVSGRSFTKVERTVAGATATYSLAYTARCVHSDRVRGAIAHGAWADALPELVREVAQRWSIVT